MNDQQLIDLLGRILVWCIGAILGLIAVITGWFTWRQRELSHRQDAFEERMDRFERHSITDETFKQALQDIREDRRDMHLENKAALAEIQRLSEAHLNRIEKKMDDYEIKDSNTRHHIANSVQALMQQVAALEALSGKDRAR